MILIAFLLMLLEAPAPAEAPITVRAAAFQLALSPEIDAALVDSMLSDCRTRSYNPVGMRKRLRELLGPSGDVRIAQIFTMALTDGQSYQADMIGAGGHEGSLGMTRRGHHVEVIVRRVADLPAETVHVADVGLPECQCVYKAGSASAGQLLVTWAPRDESP